MKKTLKYIAIVMLAVFSLSGEALAGQKNYKGELKFSEPVVKREGGTIFIDIDVDMTDLKLHKQQLIMLTPMLRYHSDKGDNTYISAPIAIAGKVRYTALERAVRFDHIYFEYEPDMVIKRKKSKKDQTIPLSLAIPYESWMAHAELVFLEEVSGCASCHVAYNEYVITSPEQAPIPQPNFVLSLILPPVEKTKYRSETYTSSLNFVVGRSDIIRNYKSNKERLDMIDRIMGSVKDDPNVAITEIRVTGYSSPDGGFDNNLAISKKRALAFVDYLKYTHNLSENMVNFYWRGEDWQGLRDKVAESQMPERGEVIEVIDNYSNIQQRKAKIRSMNYGETYYYLLGVYYPSLRRDEYTISYIAKNFEPAEAREIIKTKPQQLSLNEMFLVASTYEVGSPEFKEVFKIAVEYFPEDPIAVTNASAIDVENGDTDIAVRRLTGVENPHAWNNLGVAYVKKGDYGIASEYFLKAANAGNDTAQKNYLQLQEWLKIK